MGLGSWLSWQWRVFKYLRDNGAYRNSYSIGMSAIYLHGHRRVEPECSGEEMVFKVTDHSVDFCLVQYQGAPNLGDLSTHAFRVQLLDITDVVILGDNILQISWGTSQEGPPNRLLIQFFLKGQNHLFAQAILHELYIGEEHHKKKIRAYQADS